jgi:hypothetical protein
VLNELGELGSQFRREEALALHSENISITRSSKVRSGKGSAVAVKRVQAGHEMQPLSA